jgi:hypothetical protein
MGLEPTTFCNVRERSGLCGWEDLNPPRGPECVGGIWRGVELAGISSVIVTAFARIWLGLRTEHGPAGLARGAARITGAALSQARAAALAETGGGRTTARLGNQRDAQLVQTMRTSMSAYSA